LPRHQRPPAEPTPKWFGLLGQMVPSFWSGVWFCAS
jgi:hypothetical protein